MPGNLWRSLRYAEREEEEPEQRYRYRGDSSGESRFRRRSTAKPREAEEEKREKPFREEQPRTDDGDRPPAYPVQKYEHGHLAYQQPALRDILADLGLRMLEGAIQAAAKEIVYFFVRRRFTPPGYYEPGPKPQSRFEHTTR